MTVLVAWCIAASAAAQEDLDFDIVVLKSGVQHKVRLPGEMRPLELEDTKTFEVETSDGNKLKLTGRAIERVVYRETRKIEKMKSLVEGGEFDQALLLGASLVFAMGDENRIQTVPWHEFRLLRVQAIVGRGVRQCEAGDADAVLAEFGELSKEKDLPPEAKQRINRGYEQILGAPVDRFVADRDWEAARENLQKLRSRVGDSDAVRAFDEKLARTVNELAKTARSELSRAEWDAARRTLTEARRIRPDNRALDDLWGELHRRDPSITCGLIGELYNANPSSRASYVDCMVGKLCFRQLFRRVWNKETPNRCGYAPDLVESWQISADGTEVDLRLREDARWSDGDPVSPGDVEHTLRSAREEGQLGYNERLASLIDDVQRSDAENSLRIRFKYQSPVLLDELCFGVLPKKHAEQRLDRANPSAFVVSGAFAPFEWRDDSLIMTANRAYPSRGALSRVVLRFFENSKAAQDAFVRGEIALLGGIAHRDAEEVSRRVPNLMNGATRVQSLHFLVINSAKLPGDDPRALRLALSIAIQRDAICDAVIGEHPAPGLFPPGSWQRVNTGEPLLPKLDMEQARQKLSGDKDLRDRAWRLVHPRRGLGAAAAAELVNRLNQAEIKARPRALDAGEYAEEVMGRHDFELAFATFVLAAPLYDVSSLFQAGSLGAIKWLDDPELIKSVRRQFSTINRAHLKKEALQLENRVLEEAYFVPLWFAENSFVARHDIVGLAQAPDALFDGVDTWSVNLESGK